MTTTAVWLGSWLRGAAGADDLLEAHGLTAPGRSRGGQRPGRRTHRRCPTCCAPSGCRARTARGCSCRAPAGPSGGPPALTGRRPRGPAEPRAIVGVGLLRHEADRLALGRARRGTAHGRAGRDAHGPLGRTGAGRSLSRRPPNGSSTSAWNGHPPGPPPGSGKSRWVGFPGRWTPRSTPSCVRLAALHDALDLARAEEGAAVTAAEARARAAEVQAVLGQVEDVIVGVVGGLNAPTPAARGARRPPHDGRRAPGLTGGRPGRAGPLAG